MGSRRPAPSADKVVLDAFWKLSDKRDATRIDAAAKIVTNLKSDDDESADYVLGRLVRGLSSNSDLARQGFFVTLVELLKRHKADSDVDDGALMGKLMELKKTHLEQSSKGSKSEEGDALKGQLFCYGAALRSDVVGTDSVAGVVGAVVDISKKRSYLLLPAYMFIIDYMKSKSAEEELMAAAWAGLTGSLDFKELTLEKIWLLLEVNRLRPSCLDKQFMLTNLGRKRLVADELCSEAARCQDDASVPIHIMRRHPVFPALVSSLAEGNLLEHYWLKHVDGTLSSESATAYKNMVAFTILDIIVQSAAEDGDVMPFLTPNVVRTAVTSLSRLESAPEEDRLVLGVLAKFAAAAHKRPEMQVPLVKALLTGQGNIAFDKVSGGNVVQQLLLGCGAVAVKYAGGLYRSTVLGEPEEDSTSQRSFQERVYAAHQLAKLASHSAVAEDADWKEETLCFLLTATLFQPEKKVRPLSSAPKPFSKDARTEVQTTFFKALDFKSKRGQLDQLCDSLTRVLEHAKGLVAKSVPLARPFNEASRETWEKAIKTVSAVDAARKRGDDRKEEAVFQLLFLQMSFQLLSDPTMAADVLADLHQCYERAVSERERKAKAAAKKRRRSKASSSNEGEGGPHWIEVVVDLLISLQSHNKHVFRQLANSVLTMLCPHMTTDALAAILDVVDPAGGGENNEEEGGDDSDEWEDVDEDDEGDEDEEEEPMDEDGAEENEEEEDSSDEEFEDDDEEASKAPDEEFKNKIKEALGKHGQDDAEEYDDTDDDEIDMDDISEEDMKKMDAALANVFRQLSGKKSGGQKKRERKDALALVHFRLRALDLLENYISHQPRVSHVLLALQRTLSALEASKSKEEEPLRERLINALKKISNLKKPQQVRLQEEEEDGEGGGRLEPTHFVSVLQSLVDMANRGSAVVSRLNNPLPLFSQCCLLVLRLSQWVSSAAGEKDGGGELAEEVNQIYVKALDDFFTRQHCMLPVAFFLLPMKTNWSGSWQLGRKLCDRAFDSETRMFRRSQALFLLNELIRNRAHKEGASKEVLRNLYVKVLSVLRSEESDGGLKPKFYCEVLHLLQGIRAICDDLGVSDEESRDALDAFRERIPKNRHFQDVKRAFNKVAVQLKMKVVTGSEKKKNVVDSDLSKAKKEPESRVVPNGEAEEEEDDKDKSGGEEEGEGGDKKKKNKKRKKKAHNKEGKEEKKRKKLHAVEGQFEGMDMPDFAGFTLNDNLNFALKSESLGSNAGGSPSPAKKKKKGKKKAKTSQNGN